MNKKINCTNHPSYKKELPRLNRIIGQLDGIKKMINEERYCPDILIQLKAARSAIRNLEITLLEQHLSTCVAQTFKSDNHENQQEKIKEIKDLIKRFE